MSRALANMLGLLGAGVVGYQKGQDQKSQRERREEDDRYEREQRERTKREQQRQEEIRTESAAAYAPTTVEAEPMKPDAMDDRDVGQPGEQRVGGFVTGGRMVDGYREGGQRYATRGEADQAAAAYNAPGARTMRMADVYGNKGDPVAASNLRANARQERLGDLQMADAERSHLDKLFNESLNGIQDPAQLADLVSGSSLGGGLKLKAVPSADGKTFSFVKVNPDGTTAPASAAFANTPDGLLEAKVGMARGIPLTQKLEFLYKKQQLETEANYKKGLTEYHQAMAAAAQVRADKTGGGKSIYERMDEVDKIQLTSLQKTVQGIEEEIVKAQAANMWQEDSPNAKLLKGRLAAARMQAVAIVNKYADKPQDDPLGLRKPGSDASAPASTRPMTSMEKVLYEIGQTGDKNYDMDIGGNRVSVRDGKPVAPAPAPAAAKPAPAAAAPSASAFVPDPKMEERLQRETAEMNQAKGTRYAYSNDVTAYLKKKREAEAAQAKVDDQARHDKEISDEQRRTKVMRQAYGGV